MRLPRRCAAGFGIALALAVSGASPAPPAETARQAIERVQELESRRDPPELRACFPDHLVRSRAIEGAEAISKWRRNLAKDVARAEIVSVRERNDLAVVRMKRTNGSTFELILEHVDDRWISDAGQVFELPPRGSSGPFNGKLSRPIRLTAKTDRLRRRGAGSGYGTSAYSFGRVTGDDDENHGDVNLWFCGNCGELHARRAEIAQLSAASPDEVRGIPVDVPWLRRLAPVTGQVFVMRCRRDGWGPYDFHVVVQLTEVSRDEVELRWGVLTRGYDAPKSLQRPRPAPSGAGRDGVDGLCGKGMRRRPGPEGPTTPSTKPRSGETSDSHGEQLDFSRASRLGTAEFTEFLVRVCDKLGATQDEATRLDLMSRTRSVGPRIVEPLVEQLSALKPITRRGAIALLEHAIGFHFGYDADAPSAQRNAARDIWTDWIKLAKGKFRTDPETGRIVIDRD